MVLRLAVANQKYMHFNLPHFLHHSGFEMDQMFLWKKWKQKKKKTDNISNHLRMRKTLLSVIPEKLINSSKYKIKTKYLKAP